MKKSRPLTTRRSAFLAIQDERDMLLDLRDKLLSRAIQAEQDSKKYLTRATQAEQQCAEWKARFDGLLKFRGEVEPK